MDRYHVTDHVKNGFRLNLLILAHKIALGYVYRSQLIKTNRFMLTFSIFYSIDMQKNHRDRIGTNLCRQIQQNRGEWWPHDFLSFSVFSVFMNFFLIGKSGQPEDDKFFLIQLIVLNFKYKNIIRDLNSNLTISETKYHLLLMQRQQILEEKKQIRVFN